MARGRKNEIETAPDREIVAEFCREGLSLKQIQQRVPHYSISKIRTFRENLRSREENEAFAGNDCAAGDTVEAVLAQNRRLNSLLTEARKSKPVDVELLLKIEARIGENIKLVRAMSDENSSDSEDKEKAAALAQISTLTNILKDVADTYPQARTLIRDRMGAIM